MDDIKRYEIEGLKEIVDALKDLPVSLQSKIIKGFLAKTGRKFILNELKSQLPYSQKIQGHGKFNGRDRYKIVSDPNDKNAVYIGVSADAYWMRFNEGGTKERHTRGEATTTKIDRRGRRRRIYALGANRGRIMAKNQVRTVIESQIDPIIKYTNEELGNEINLSIERRTKRINKILNK